MSHFLISFRPEFNFTSQYLVRVDDFFLHYLQKVRNLLMYYFSFPFAVRYNGFIKLVQRPLTNHN